MSLEVGSVVYNNEGVAIVYASYPTTNEVVLKFLNKYGAVITKRVTNNGITLASSVSNKNKIIENIQTQTDETIKKMLLKLNNINIPKPQQSTKTITRRIIPSRKSVAEMISARYSSSSSSSSDEDSNFDITQFKEANGRRSRRRISRHHKKTNSRRKSNPHKMQSRKK
jgi:hypothetical protein